MTGSCVGSSHGVRSRIPPGPRASSSVYASCWSLATKRSWFHTLRTLYWPNTSTSPDMAGRVAQPLMDHDAALAVDLGDLTEVVDPVEDTSGATGCVEGTLASFSSSSIQTGIGYTVTDSPVRLVTNSSDPCWASIDRPEGIGDLESPFVIDLRGIVAPQDGCLSPLSSTNFHRDTKEPAFVMSTAKAREALGLRLIFARFAQARQLACVPPRATMCRFFSASPAHPVT